MKVGLETSTSNCQPIRHASQSNFKGDMESVNYEKMFDNAAKVIAAQDQYINTLNARLDALSKNSVAPKTQNAGFNAIG